MAAKTTKKAAVKRKTAKKSVTLLAGGNPQIAKAEGDTPVGWFLSFHTFTNYVKVAFFRGTSLRPVPPGKSKHKEVRCLDIREEGPLDEAQLASWIRQAAALPGWDPSRRWLLAPHRASRSEHEGWPGRLR